MATSVPSYTPETAKVVADLGVQAMEFEFPVNKKVIEAVTNPNFRLDPKSRTALEQAWHIASADVQFMENIADMNFPMEETYKEMPKTIADILAWYDTKLPQALARVKALTPEQLSTPVDFYGVWKYPLFRYIDFAVRHSVHHRGYLAASLRSMGSKVPSIFGGSADEPFEMK
ncbi:MAG TPA: DinB family protein [Terriglobales bacterium]|nr:DinB family protein [Terriglobales bacterium]